MDQMKPDFSKGNGLLPAVVQHSLSGAVLMLGYMNQEALRKTEETGKVHFFSRSRNALWMKGETSGNTLSLVSLSIDCDNDTFLVKALPQGPTCHTGSSSCFGSEDGWGPEFLPLLEDLIAARKSAPDEKSYVSSLFKSGTKKIAQKVVEEAGEVAIEAVSGDRNLLREEAADLLFHFLILLADQGLSLDQVVMVLQQRHQQRTR